MEPRSLHKHGNWAVRKSRSVGWTQFNIRFAHIHLANNFHHTRPRQNSVAVSLFIEWWPLTNLFGSGDSWFCGKMLPRQKSAILGLLLRYKVLVMNSCVLPICLNVCAEKLLRKKSTIFDLLLNSDWLEVNYGSVAILRLQRSARKLKMLVLGGNMEYFQVGMLVATLARLFTVESFNKWHHCRLGHRLAPLHRQQDRPVHILSEINHTAGARTPPNPMQPPTPCYPLPTPHWHCVLRDSLHLFILAHVVGDVTN